MKVKVKARARVDHLRRVPDCVPTSGLAVYLFLDAVLFFSIVSSVRYLLDRYADDFERWGIVDIHDGIPFWTAMVGCPVGVAILMPLLHRRWSYLERPHVVITFLVTLHVVVLRYYGNPPMLSIQRIRSMLRRVRRPEAATDGESEPPKTTH